jgi:hypothetical protein
MPEILGNGLIGIQGNVFLQSFQDFKRTGFPDNVLKGLCHEIDLAFDDEFTLA